MPILNAPIALATFLGVGLASLRLTHPLGEVHSGVDVVSAYLIPGRAATDLFAGLAAEGRAARPRQRSELAAGGMGAAIGTHEAA